MPRFEVRDGERFAAGSPAARFIERARRAWEAVVLRRRSRSLLTRFTAAARSAAFSYRFRMIDSEGFPSLLDGISD
ncbi:hypothetical protein ASG52_23520 [Methylobacterium sp. Leaf456]|nr:hypothetical protein ASG52_23520 [Methylobacterium sp. Leaf456]